jgi:histidyl-tRNA synthetase
VSGFSTSPGTRDILPPDAGRWRAFQDVFEEVAVAHGYRYLIPPMFEDLGVFLRLGEATDVVTKEMYDFEDKGGRRVALRPEQTASVCRAYAQHRPVPPWKVWYAGPNFRYEKPQHGRYRQFDQVGVELLGPCDPDADAEVIALAWAFYRRLGLTRIALSVNTLGDEGDLQRYTAVLHAYLAERIDELSEESRATLARNPLRVLDSKRPADAAVVAAAPRIVDHVGDGARAHFDRVLATLGSLGIPYSVEDRLVRGLDYYRHTTFEFASTALDAAHVAVGGGGRYDGLVEALGGPPTPGVGFALGLDRTLLACDAEACFPAPDPSVDVFVVDTTGGREATLVTDELRRVGRSADRAYEQRSMKSQMKIADRSGARVAVILGTDELASGTIVVRSMESGEQRTVARSEMVGAVAALLGGVA